MSRLTPRSASRRVQGPSLATWPLLMAPLVFACGAGGGAEPARGPNLLLISIDSLRPDHLGCYGYPRPTSPVIDRIAREGVRFRTAVSTTSWTLPSHAAMFTGMYDTAHGLVDNGLRLDDRHRTLAETLQEHGYQTAGFFGGPYLHPTFGLAQGFDHYQSCMTTLPDDLSDEQVEAQSRAPIGASHSDVTGPRTVKEFERWLDGADHGRPFFAFVHLWDVHYDYIPPPEIAALFVDPSYRGPVTGRDFARLIRERPRMSRPDAQQLVSLYDAEIRSTDAVVGQLVGRLERDGLLEDTVVVITADHGEEFFEHGGLGHQSTLFDEQILVPLIVRWPAAFEPRAVDDQVRLIDLMPTLLTLAGIERQPTTQGRSLVPLCLGEELPPEPALCELLVDLRSLRALREPDWKFFDAEHFEQRGGVHLAEDPHERTLLQDPAVVGAGMARLRAEITRTGDFGARQVGAGTRRIEVPPDLEEALRGLGYTDADE